MDALTRKILELFYQEGGKKWKFGALLQVLEGYDESVVQAALDDLWRKGWLTKSSKNKWSLDLVGKTFVGEITYFYEQVELRSPLLPFPIHLGRVRKLHLLPGEKVEVECIAVYPQKVEGKVLRKIAPSEKVFVGILERGKNGRWYVHAQQPFLGWDFEVPAAEVHPTWEGKKVAVRPTGWATRYPKATLVEVLGSPRQHTTEMHAIILEYDLPTSFPPQVCQEAEALPEELPAEVYNTRHDFRDILTFTIDPEDAKDFDDAISLRRLSDNLYEVGVHIADVTYYVQPDSALDKEAFFRGNTVYLVDRTLPMLPPRLSENLCSLVPHQDRAAFSAVFQIDLKGNVHQTWLGRSVIRSQYRLSYEQAQEILQKNTPPLGEALRALDQITRALHRVRVAQGGLVLHESELKFRIDESGNPIEWYEKRPLDTHRIIEELMLLANRSVAQFLTSKNFPMIYRVHPFPDLKKIEVLKQFVEGFGYELQVSSSRKLTESLNALAAAVMGKPEEAIIQSVLLRSLPRAVYTPHNLGHYGLGFVSYTHFTSPIRRYADVLVHRILWAALTEAPFPYTPDKLDEMGKHISQREKIASDAERASLRYKQLEYLAVHREGILPGMIVGVTSWGLYVELALARAEGLVSIRDLPTDSYQVEPYMLKARYRHRKFRLGDPVEVQVEEIDFDRRQVDLHLVSHHGERISAAL
ncbi:MAG: ribonuclease R family protein [Bacteroidia bacterium]